MTLEGEYEPSPEKWVRDQVEEFEASNGQRGNILRGNPEWPIVVITSRGAKSGKLRKNPVMRVERDGKYVAIASQGRRPRRTPPGTTTSSPTPRSTSRTAPRSTPTPPASSRATSAPSGGTTPWRTGRRTASTRRRPTARSRSSCSNASDSGRHLGAGSLVERPCAVLPLLALHRVLVARRPRRTPRLGATRRTPRDDLQNIADAYGRITGPGGQLQNPAYLPALVAASTARTVEQLLTQAASPTRLALTAGNLVPGLERRQPAARRLGAAPAGSRGGRLHEPVRRPAARHRLPPAARRPRPLHRRAADRAVPRRGAHRGLGAGLGGHVRVARPGPRRARLRRADLRRAGPGHQRDAPPPGLAAAPDMLPFCDPTAPARRRRD